jgi:molybdopterin-guanine dinucleotide biosynthesis protein A
MGTDKANLIIDGRRLVEVMAERLKSIEAIDAVVISGSREKYGDLGFACVEDQMSGLGPLEGLRSVVCHLKREGLQASRLLVVPVDMPGLRSSHLQSLLSANDGDRNDGVAAVGFVGYELPALFHNDERLRGYLDGVCGSESVGKRSRSFQRLFAELGKAEVAFIGDEPEMSFLNANTPEEWKRFLR